MMKYLPILLLMIAGVCNAALIDYSEISSSGPESELWSVSSIGTNAVEVRGVNDGFSGYVIVGETVDMTAFDVVAFTLDVKNVDDNDTFQYFLYAEYNSNMFLDGAEVLAPGESATLTFDPSFYSSLTGTGSITYGVGILGGDDIFVTEFSELDVPEPVTVASLAIGGLILLSRRK